MKKVIDIIGNKYGRLTVVSRAENKGRLIQWNCKCDCGGKNVVGRGSLVGGTIKSCGCLKTETLTTHGMCDTPTHNTWKVMKQRCNNPKNTNYKHYGAKGITVCKRWEKFENFYEDMGERPEGKTLDRKNCKKGYSKENCRWATISEQNVNRGTNKNNTSGRKGVYLRKQGDWMAKIVVDRKEHFLGAYKEFQHACDARSAGEIKFYGKLLPQ